MCYFLIPECTVLSIKPAMTSVAQLEHCPIHWKVADSIPGQGTCLGYGFGSQLGHVQEEVN